MRVALRAAAVMVAIAVMASGSASATPEVGVREVTKGFSGSMRKGNTTVTVYFVDGNGVAVNDVPPQADTDSGVNACALLSTYKLVRSNYGYSIWSRYDFGCGRLTVTADELLDVARARGYVRSYYTGGKITVDVTLRATTPNLPYGSVHENTPDGVSFYPDLDEPEDSVWTGISFDTSGGVRREAKMNGTVRSSFVSLSSGQGRGYLYRGASMWVGSNGEYYEE